MQAELLQHKFQTGGRKSRHPFISVITACYNAEATLAHTIESLGAQSCQQFEYIIADGGSRDGTLRAIEAHAELIDFWISTPDKGMYDAMNRGASIASGQYLAFLNADDRYTPECIQLLTSSSAFGQADVIHGNMVKERELDGTIYSREERPDPDFMPKGMGIFHPASIVKKSTFREMGGYDLRYKQASDYDFFLKLWLYGRSFYYIDKPLAYFSLGGSSNAGCTTYSEAVAIQKAQATGTARRTTLLLWKCRIRKTSRTMVLSILNAIGLKNWAIHIQKQRWQ